MYRSFHSSLIALLITGTMLVACSGTPEIPPTTVAVQPSATPTTEPTATPTAEPSATPRPSATPVPPTPTVVPNPTADPITGAPALARGAVKERPYVVMIDNHPDAYPQSGMDKAALVFEALAEYGVTRFITVYVPGITPNVNQIGPVRSTRTYFVEWAMAFHGMYAHAGGSPQGIALAESTTELVNLDALAQNGATYFVRSSARFAPHNLYTSSADLARAAADFDATEFEDEEIGFLFKEDSPASQRPDSGTFSYFFIYRDAPAGWIYNPDTNGYLRTRYGRPAIDAVTGEQLWTKNVVVMEVQEGPIPGDTAGRIDQLVIGSGRARLFIDGLDREVVWRKDSQADHLRFYQVNDVEEEIRFNAGPVWIVALPSLDNLTVQ